MDIPREITTGFPPRRDCVETPEDLYRTYGIASTSPTKVGRNSPSELRNHPPPSPELGDLKFLDAQDKALVETRRADIHSTPMRSG